MNKWKYQMRLVILNFVIMYVLLAFGSWLLLNLEYNWELTSHEWVHIFSYSFGFTSIWSLVLWNKSKYKMLKIQNKSREEMEKLERFLFSNKVKIISSHNNTNMYKVRSKYSLIALNFSISSEESNYLINAPRVIIHDIFTVRRLAIINEN